MTSFPIEIFDDEILPKLPVKSLLRFKSISEHYNSLISSPNFATLHLTNSIGSDANRLLIVNNHGPHLIDLENPKNPHLPLPLPASFRPHLAIPIAGSCDGLLLLRPNYGDEGCLSLLAESPVHGSIDLRVMKEYGVVESWVKLFKVPNREWDPLGYARGSSRNVLVYTGWQYNGYQLIWYDIKKNQYKNANIRDISFVDCDQVFMFKGSLLNLPGPIRLELLFPSHMLGDYY